MPAPGLGLGCSWGCPGSSDGCFPGRYMKYLYPYECEKRGLSNPNELQAAIDSNRREGRRQSFGGSLFTYSPSGTHSMLSSPKLSVPALGLAGATNGSPITPVQKIKKGNGAPGLSPGPGGVCSSQAGPANAPDISKG